MIDDLWCKNAVIYPFQWAITPLVVHRPKGFAAKNELRHQFHHVIGIAPTILKAIGIEAPARSSTENGKP